MTPRTISLGALLLGLAACPKPPPTGATGASNRAADDAPLATCPALVAEPEPPPSDDCVRGELVAALDAPATAPSCHQVVQRSPISGIEQIVLPAHGTVRLTHGGCAHWSLTIELAAPTGGAPGAADVYRHAATVLRALPARGDDGRLRGLADALEAAATARTALGESLAITDGFEYVSVTLDGERVVVIDDVAL